MEFFETISGGLLVAGNLVLSPLLRGWYNHWGATQEEVDSPLAGDELVPKPRMGYTRAITIHANAERVWAWLIQLGHGRGGLFSYDNLENLVGCDIQTLEKIVPELQNPKMGDLIRLGPEGYPCFSIASIDTLRSLVLISADPKLGHPVELNPQAAKGYSIATWQFVLQPISNSVTRLITRQRLDYSKDMVLIWRLTEPVGFIMERKMLLNIRKLAESTI